MSGPSVADLAADIARCVDARVVHEIMWRRFAKLSPPNALCEEPWPRLELAGHAAVARAAGRRFRDACRERGIEVPDER